MQSVFELTENNFSTQLAGEVCSAILDRLDNLSENEIKELDKDILKGIIDVHKEYMVIIEPKEEAEKFAELRELHVAEKYLRCPFFEKRVRGINELKEISFKVMNSLVKNKGEQLEFSKWLTVDSYCAWLTEHKIIEFIFIENPHVELIRRSFEVMRMLANDDKYFTNEVIEMLWVCCSEKHEDIVRASLDLVQDLALYMPLEKLSLFSSKFKQLKETDYDEKLVYFLKNYTLNTMKNIVRLRNSQKQSLMNKLIKGKEVKIDETKYIDLTLFWQIFQESYKVAPKVKDLALNSLVELLQEFNDSDQKSRFMSLALENIKRGDTFFSSLIFLRKVLNTFPLDAQVKFKGSGSTITVSTVLQEIVSKVPLFDLILQNLKEYMRSAKASESHEDFIGAVTGFIEYVLVNSKMTLTFDQVEIMFQLMVTKAVSEFESNALFDLITKENEISKSKERRFLLDDKVRNEVFQKIFCNSKYLNFEKMNMEGFSCFKRLFLIVNEEDKLLEAPKEDRVVVINLNSLQGLDTLWLIAIMCDNAQVKELCKNFLVDLYLKIKTTKSGA